MDADAQALRASVSLEQRALLDLIWDAYVRSECREWPRMKSIHLRSSREAVQAHLRELPPGAVLPTSDERYSLSLLGLLLTRLGAVLESILVDYLEWLRQEALRNPDVERITSAQVRAGIDEISDEESLLLAQAIHLGGFWGGTGSFSVPAWECGVPDDLDELPAITDLRTYVWQRACSDATRAARTAAPLSQRRVPQGAVAESQPVPSAFISYSRETDHHRAWVRELAARLRQDGVKTSLDQWETVPGDQLPNYMERAIRENDYVLIICTPRYKRRSEAREGGVGYEGDIMTAEIFAKGNHRKFIPILARGVWNEAAPAWLAGKYRVDLSARPYSEEDYRDLLTTIHRSRPEPPPVGRPFSTVSPTPGATAPLPPLTTPPNDDIQIDGVIVDEVTEPRNDGTRGSALYAVPFRLSRRPSQAWADLFLQNWKSPATSTLKHRPGIASVRGGKIVLDGTTLEEVRDYHRDTLKLVLAETNRQHRDHVKRQLAAEEARRRQSEEHRKNVEEQARGIRFDE